MRMCFDKIIITDPYMALALLSDSSQRGRHSQLDISRLLTSIQQCSPVSLTEHSLAPQFGMAVNHVTHCSGSPCFPLPSGHAGQL